MRRQAPRNGMESAKIRFVIIVLAQYFCFECKQHLYHSTTSVSTSLLYLLQQVYKPSNKMKLTIACLLLTTVSGFVSTNPSRPAFYTTTLTENTAGSSTASSTALFDSRRRQKVASVSGWLEKRGFAPKTTDTVVASSTETEAGDVVAGLMTNEQGLEYVKLVSANGSSAEVYLYGGVVTSYTDSDGTEFIAVRPDAKMDGSKPISGGLSHCWPQFGPGEIQQHGFARNVNWSVDTMTDTSVTMKLLPNDYTKAIWDKSFVLTFTVSINDDKLDTKLVADNTGSDAWNMQAALHSYFTVSDLTNLQITGSFAGKQFLNKMAGEGGVGEMQQEDRDTITISEEYDRVYTGVNDPILKDNGTGKLLSVVNTNGWVDTVLWNPYGNTGMGYNNFVCVESVKFDPVTVDGGSSWTGEMSLQPGSL